MKGPQIPKDNGENISLEEWNTAIKLLLREIPEDTLKDIWIKCFRAKEIDLLELHLGFGMTIRNILRSNKFNWGSISLDENWQALLEDVLHEFAKRNQLK